MRLRCFFAWQSEPEHRWLETMAAKGLHLDAVWPFAYRFEKGAPRQVAYTIDYRRVGPSERPEYIQLFRDAGWENIASLGDWHYFRSLEGKRPNKPLSDNRSIVERYRRLLATLVVSEGFLVAVLAGRHSRYGSLSDLVRVLVLVLVALGAFGIITLIRKIDEVRRQPKE